MTAPRQLSRDKALAPIRRRAALDSFSNVEKNGKTRADAHYHLSCLNSPVYHPAWGKVRPFSGNGILQSSPLCKGAGGILSSVRCAVSAAFPVAWRMGGFSNWVDAPVKLAGGNCLFPPGARVDSLGKYKPPLGGLGASPLWALLRNAWSVSFTGLAVLRQGQARSAPDGIGGPGGSRARKPL